MRHAAARRRRLGLAVAALSVAALGVALPAIALNVVGGNGPDVLRGTQQSDRMNGKGGGDRLFGLAGNDILTGGPGADYASGGPGNDRLLLRDDVRDRAVCGAGRDTVVGDRVDRVDDDCEVVRLAGAPNPSPPPSPPPPPPPPPPPTDTPVTPGAYRGQSQTGNFVFFDVTANRAVTGWRVNDIRRQCDAPIFLHGSMDLGSTVLPIDARGQFGREFRYDTSIRNDKGELTPAVGVFRIAGTVNGSMASGTFFSSYEFTRDGRPVRCAAEETWTATRVS